MAHFYENTEKGVEARHYVPMVSRPDELRPTRLSDVKKMWKEGRSVAPSVTTILNILDKSALTNWKIDQHLEQAYHLVKQDSGERLSALFSLESWKEQVKLKTELQMDIAPNAGSDFHKLMENYDNGKLDNQHPMFGLCQKVHNEIAHRLDDLDTVYTTEQNFWRRECCISDLNYGGQVDLHIYTGNNIHWIIDYKTKQTKAKFKPGKMVYQDHYMQLAAYREGMELPDAKCANVFICLEDGSIDCHEHTEKDLIKGWQMFENCLELWYLINED